MRVEVPENVSGEDSMQLMKKETSNGMAMECEQSGSSSRIRRGQHAACGLFCHFIMFHS